MCSRTTYLVDVNHNKYLGLFEMSKKLNYLSIAVPDLSLVPSMSEIINDDKFLMHIRNISNFKAKIHKFYTIAKITYFGKLEKSNNTGNQKDFRPYIRVTLSDPLYNSSLSEQVLGLEEGVGMAH
uniref:DUF223 domain-containing protein n=1 Tax=Strongyloides venezuelensis TaxID=75913 RepID=A0A0K0FFN9_STRVS